MNQRQHEKHLEVAETSNKGHGRLEQRRLEVSTRLAGHLDGPGLQQVCRLTRTTRRRGQWTTEIDYAVTSVPRAAPHDMSCGAAFSGSGGGDRGVLKTVLTTSAMWHCRKMAVAFAPAMLRKTLPPCATPSSPCSARMATTTSPRRYAPAPGKLNDYSPCWVSSKRNKPWQRPRDS